MTIRAAATVCAAVLVAASPARSAALGDNTVKLAPSLMRLPQNIGPLRFSGENRFTDRRMGRSFGYNASGISLNIYVYDYGEHDTPDGPDSVTACEQFESARREIERGGNYQNVSLRGEYTRAMSNAPGAPRAREAEYEFDRNGIHAVSVLWVTAADGHFVKLRLSLRTEVADELDEARTQILESMARAITARPPRAAPVDPAPPQEASIDIDANPDSAAASAWLAYAVELARYSGEHPETRPRCGGRFAPGFEAELTARGAALREYRARDPAQRTSSYFNDLARVEAAGFLDEYVWTYLRNENADLTPPPSIGLDAFEQFRARELATHIVQTGAHVMIHSVRKLPAPPP